MSEWYFRTEHYKYPEPYETGNITIVRATLKGDDANQCPHCNTNHNSWAMRDGKDLYCFYCGWRESFYFAPSVLRWISRAMQVEHRIGEPILLTNKREEALRRKREDYALHRDEIIQRYNQRVASLSDEEKEARREANRIRWQNWYRRNKEEQRDYRARYNAEHLDKKREYGRNHMRRKREGLLVTA